MYSLLRPRKRFFLRPVISEDMSKSIPRPEIISLYLASILLSISVKFSRFAYLEWQM